jgi:hypothetical protein
LLLRGNKFPAAILTKLVAYADFRHQPMTESLLPLQTKAPVSSRQCEKISSHECNWAYRYQFFPKHTDKPHILAKDAKTVFLQCKEQGLCK